MKKLLLGLFIFPGLAFSYNFNDFFHADLASSYIEKMAQCLQEADVAKGREVLERWYAECPEDIPYITGMHATLYLMDGEIDQSKYVMQKACAQLSQINFPKELLDTIIELFISLPDDKMDHTLTVENPLIPGMVQLIKDKVKQPRGVKFKFWIGVAQVVGGCLAMPFNPVAGGALIGAGASCVIDATSDALDNKEKWEQDLNDRQRITPENFDPKPKTNSFYDSRNSRFQLYAC